MRAPRRRSSSAGRSARGNNIRITVVGCNAKTAAVLRRAARHTLIREGKMRATVEIVVIGDEAMRAAHARWKNSTAPTDVLSFDLSDDSNRLEGILLVCDETARRESHRRRIPVIAEMALYVVHGALHLAGHDDRLARDFRRMHRREDELLVELGLGPVFGSS